MSPERKMLESPSMLRLTRLAYDMHDPKIAQDLFRLRERLEAVRAEADALIKLVDEKVAMNLRTAADALEVEREREVL